MSKSVEKAANFYTAYLTSDDSSVLLSPAIQSAIDGQLQVLKKQISYKRYIVTEIIPNDVGLPASRTSLSQSRRKTSWM